MATKHDVLTEEELAHYHVNSNILELIARIKKESGIVDNKDINILDWGCGRGRSVAKLLQDGYNAYGVDIDLNTIKNGHALFKNRGWDPDLRLLRVEDVGKFTDGYFSCLFSEQVFEHVEHLGGVVSEMARLTRLGGKGIHLFPGSNMIMEAHINMPFVHWLPKNSLRKYAIAMFMRIGYGPKGEWPETVGQTFGCRVGTFYQYMNNNTFYRDTKSIQTLCEELGFEACYQVSGKSTSFKMLPRKMRRNGFPMSSVTLMLERK